MEHAAILVGYYLDDKDMLFFKITQVGKYFNVNAKALFASTDQLPKMRLIQENYFKLNRKDEGEWVSESYAKRKHCAFFLEKRLREKNPTKCNGLNKKILLVDSKIRPQIKFADLPVKFEKPISFTRDFFEGFTCQTNDLPEDKRWDEQAKANRNVKAVSNMMLLKDDRPSLISAEDPILMWDKVETPSLSCLDLMLSLQEPIYLYTKELEVENSDYIFRKIK